jgi:ceramide glucosyltransferase
MDAMTVIASALLLLAVLGLVLIAVQVVAAFRHLRSLPPAAQRQPGISVLKPLCGVDDDLRENLASFAALEYPDYEVLLGVQDLTDAAYPVARAAAERWPDRMRVVIQRGEPGLNPKVNQLITLAQSADHEILVISDSNVAAPAGYLDEIAAHLEQPSIGLVTHPIAGSGERALGAFMDNVHLSTAITPGMVAAKTVADFAIVVGKSMALRRSDLAALGGFEAVKDVLAEDYVMGCMVRERLGLDVAVAHRPIRAVSRDRTLRGFYQRYQRWGTIQRYSVGLPRYVALLSLNPFALALLALVLDPSRFTLMAVLSCWTAKAVLELAADRTVRASEVTLPHVLGLPLKDAILFAAWLVALLRTEVNWRGNRLAVRSGTRLEPVLATGGDPRWRSAPSAVLVVAARLFR